MLYAVYYTNTRQILSKNCGRNILGTGTEKHEELGTVVSPSAAGGTG